MKNTEISGEKIMKKIIIILFILLSSAFLYSNPDPVNGSWWGPYKILEIQPARDHKIIDSGYPIYIKWDLKDYDDSRIPRGLVLSPYVNYWVIDSNIDDGRRMLNTVMMAFTLDNKVHFNAWSHVTINGHPYPGVGAVKIVNE